MVSVETSEVMPVEELDQWFAGECCRLARLLREARRLSEWLGIGGAVDAQGNTYADTLATLAERALIEAR